jgi:hypothetical protein
LTQSSFNNPSDVPPGVFEIAIEPDMEVSDYRSGVRFDYGGKNKNLMTREDAQSLVAEFMQDDTSLATPLKTDAKQLPRVSNESTPFLHRSYYAIRHRKALVVSVGLASVALGMLVLVAARRRNRRSGNR